MSESSIRITDIVDFNPKRAIKKGSIAPFVDMAALPVDSRDISSIGEREFKGSGSKFKNGDTLFARITPCLENGKTAKVSGLAEVIAAHGSTEFIVMSAKEPKYDEDFVYYLAILPEFRSYAQVRMEGTSGRQRVPWQSLADFEFEFPSKEKRKEIGAFLKAIDDKIDLNRQTNQTLEQIAQAIFKSWFVDFEPVKAKIQAKQALSLALSQREREAKTPLPLEEDLGEGDNSIIERAAMCAISGKIDAELDQLNAQQYHQLATTAALFPDAMQESELGEIPEGWGISTLGEHFDVVMGQSPKGDTYNENGEGMLFFQGRRDFGFRYPAPRVYTTAPKRLAQAGDTLISVRAPVGDRNMANQECCLGRGVAGIRHKSGAISFTYAFIGHIEKSLSDSGSDGTVFSSINKNELNAVEFVTPKNSLVSLFEDSVDSIDRQIEINSVEIETLEKLRDTLLPKLLSGELSLTSTDIKKNAEKEAIGLSNA